MEIPLPKCVFIGTPQGHKYPLQIGMQTLEYLQASIFHAALSDKAAGEFIKIPGAMKKVEKFFLKDMAKDTYDFSWECLKKFKPVFENIVFANVLITFCSQWDWYIRKLSDFIIFSLDHLHIRCDKRKLKQINYKPILEQINIIEKICSVKFELQDHDKNNLVEMYLVRNLGLHNRWEIDNKYKLLSLKKELIAGNIRLINKYELQEWQKSLDSLIIETALKIAKLYKDVPDFN